MLQVSCLLEDVAGNRNPICAGTEASASGSGSPMYGVSLLQPFSEGQSLCIADDGSIPRVATAKSTNTEDTLSARYAAYYNVQVSDGCDVSELLLASLGHQNRLLPCNSPMDSTTIKPVAVNDAITSPRE